MNDSNTRELLEPLRRRWWLVAFVTLAVSAIAYFHFQGSSPEYTASTTVYVQPSSLDTLLGDAVGGTDADRTVNNQARLLETPAVANEVALRLDFDGDPDDLLSLVTATAEEDSDFMLIEATASDPQFAAAVANGFAEGFVRLDERRLGQDAAEARKQIQRQLSQLTPTIDNATVRQDLQQRLARIALVEAVPTQAGRQIDRAVAPAETSDPTPLQKAIFAGLLGLILGCALVYGLNALDRRVPASDVEAEYGAPLLGSMPLDRKAASQAKGPSPLPLPMVEPVRTIRTTLARDLPGGEAPRTLLVMSAIPGEGKSTVTKALALGFHEGGRNVLVIDADMRHPVLNWWFGVRREPGLSDILRSEASLEEAAHEAIPDAATGEKFYLDGAPEPDSIVRSSESVSVAGETSRGGDSTSLEPAVVKAGSQRPRRNTKRNPKATGTPESGNGNGSGPVEPVLHLVSSGTRVRDPAALLGSEPMGRFLTEAAASYDIVVIDSSPLLAVSDATPLAAAVDGVVAVTRSGLSTHDEAKRFRRALDRLPEVNLLGLVLNGVRDPHAQPRYYDAGYG